MQQKKMKTLTLALVVILVLALALAFVACNPNNDNGNNTPGGNSGNPGESTQTPTTGLANVMSEEQFNAIYSYLYSVDLGENGSVYSYMYFYSDPAMKNGENLERGDLPFSLDTMHGVVMVSLCYESSYDAATDASNEESASLAFFSSPEEAESVLDSLTAICDAGMESHIVGNVAVVETEKGLFENKILKATMPDSVSDARKDMMKQAYAKMRDAYCGSGYFSLENDEKINQFIYYPEHGNCEERYSYVAYDIEKDEKEKQDFEESKRKYFTADSYCDTTREQGYAFIYVKYRPGFYYEPFGWGDDTGKVYIREYYHNEDVVENLVIPAKIGDTEIFGVLLFDDDIKSVIIEKGIIKAEIYSDALTSIKSPESILELDLDAISMEMPELPSSLKRLTASIDSLTNITLPTTLQEVNLQCQALKTVNYAGSTADFEEKYGDAVKGWCNISDFNPTTSEYTYTEITISVVCNNGILTCTKDGIVK